MYKEKKVKEMLKKIFYLKQVVIYLLKIWIIEGIHQNSASCVRVVCIEVMGIRTNIHQMAQNWDAV